MEHKYIRVLVKTWIHLKSNVCYVFSVKTFWTLGFALLLRLTGSWKISVCYYHMLFIHTMYTIVTCLSSTTPPIDIHEIFFIGSERHLVNESTKHCLTKWQLVCVHNFQCINTYGCRVHCLLSLYGSHTRALNSLASVAASPNTTQWLCLPDLSATSTAVSTTSSPNLSLRPKV